MHLSPTSIHAVCSLQTKPFVAAQLNASHQSTFGPTRAAHFPCKSAAHPVTGLRDRRTAIATALVECARQALACNPAIASSRHKVTFRYPVFVNDRCSLRRAFVASDESLDFDFGPVKAIGESRAQS